MTTTDTAERVAQDRGRRMAATALRTMAERIERRAERSAEHDAQRSYCSCGCATRGDHRRAELACAAILRAAMPEAS